MERLTSGPGLSWMEMVGGDARGRHTASAGRHRPELDMLGTKSGVSGGPRHRPGSALMIATPGTPHI